MGLQVLEIDAQAMQPPDQVGDAGLLGLGVETVDQFMAVRLQGQRLTGQFRRQGFESGLQMQGQLLAAQLGSADT